MKVMYLFLIVVVLIVIITMFVLSIIPNVSIREIVDNFEFYEDKGVTVTGIYNEFIVGVSSIKYGLHDTQGYVIEIADSCFSNQYFQIGKIYTLTGFIRTVQSGSAISYVLDCSMHSPTERVVNQTRTTRVISCEYGGKMGVCRKTGTHVGNFAIANPCPEGEKGVWNHPNCPDLYICCIEE